ncbi:AraC family transcriptional regulator [Colwellia psychrerythraea]|uniref:Transcriptional regulator, araC family n=1 Tax=Colwellia psychrerythraea (strain 34H / ATCC BAA-681) TaxID=167879 RepID=Q485B0_COLP3|nr:AraC family transcriptional regulator [Colwellia psychrerythraea]AAZ27265.1 transcriptional regulator, araC family [Colwellia psychrerythraea 34H]
MDSLSSILKSVRLQGSVYFNACFASPWGLDLDQNQRAYFHLIIRGACYLQLGDKKEQLQGGDIIILPHGTAHQLFDDPSSVRVNATGVVPGLIDGINPFEGVGHSQDIDILCGYFNFNNSTPSYFLNALPDVIHLTQEHRTHFSFLDNALSFITQETKMKNLGREILIDRVTELLFVQIMRVYININGNEENIFSALSDRTLSEALQLMHTESDKNWTVESLAKAIGMSRSRFSEHFHNYIGETPMRYLHTCRMEVAKQKIEETESTLNIISEEVGYASDSAFKKAFKKFFGNTPSTFRQKNDK